MRCVIDLINYCDEVYSPRQAEQCIQHKL